MPRKKRIFRINYLHHVMLRGVNGQDIFLNDQDRARFCLLLQAACEKHNLAIHGFCFMTNHVHLMIEPLKQALHEGIHAFAFRYAQYFNRRHKRRGYLFQGRYRSILVEDGVYLKRLTRYIHLNPVEANLVSRPEHFPWSSYRAYLGHDNYVWLSTDRVLSKFGELREEAIENLVSYTHQRSDAELDLTDISKSFRKGFFGNEDSIFDEVLEPNDTCGSFFLDLSLKDAISLISKEFNVTLEDLSSQSKNKHIVDARSVLALIARHSKKWSLESLSSALNKNSGTLSRLASRAEQQPELLSMVCNGKFSNFKKNV